MERVTVFYSGRVQGVGFRMTVRQIACGYDVTGTVRNLPDGRVEMIAEGARTELQAFLDGINESELSGFIAKQHDTWERSKGNLRGFAITHYTEKTMAQIQKNPQVDAHLKKATKWQKELEKLRSIILSCGLTEELKWGKPCYTVQGANLIMIYGLKESCAIAFFNGPLLKDTHGLLAAPGPNSQANRWVKFTSVEAITEKEAILKAYIQESVTAEKKGLKVVFKKTPEPVPGELQKILNKNPALKKAFAALTPGRQRGYILYFNAAKQAKTRDSRIEKCLPQIFAGKGYNERPSR